MSSSEERKDQLGTDLVHIDYKLNERLSELEEWEVIETGGLNRWEGEYRTAEKSLLASLGAKETVEYLQAKSKLMHEHSKAIS